MSDSTDPVRTRLRAYAEGLDPKPPSPAVISHFLGLLGHAEQRIHALQSTAPAAALPANLKPSESICQEADRLVSSDRLAQYGHPFDGFLQVGAMWEAILGVSPGKIGPEEVALCMIALKISRECHKPSRDNRVDIAGYAKCLDLIGERRASMG